MWRKNTEAQHLLKLLLPCSRLQLLQPHLCVRRRLKWGQRQLGRKQEAKGLGHRRQT